MDLRLMNNGSPFFATLVEIATITQEEEKLATQLEDKAPRRKRLDQNTRLRLEKTKQGLKQNREKAEQRLRDLGPLEEQWALERIIPNCTKIATDPIGRRLLEKFFEVATSDSSYRLVTEGLNGLVMKLSNHQHGCHVIQAVIQVSTPKLQEAIANELRGQICECIDSPNGNHVIQKMVLHMPAGCVRFIVKECTPATVDLAKHSFGCRVLQRLLEHCPPADLSGMLQILLDNFYDLVTDAFGNYVLQHVLEYGRPEDQRVIVEKLVRGVAKYATHKCASNIVEKALKVEEELVCAEGRKWHLQELQLACAVLGTNTDPNPPILVMTQDKYANYIIQRMLKEPTPAVVRDLAVQRLAPNRDWLHHLPHAQLKYAKHTLVTLDQILGIKEEKTEQETCLVGESGFAASLEGLELTVLSADGVRAG